MTNKEIIFRVLTDALDAHNRVIILRDALESLCGEDFPITRQLDEILDLLTDVSTIHYNLGGGAEVSEQEFIDWIDAPRNIGPCKKCAHRASTDHEGFHRCALAKDNACFSPEYACYDFKPLSI